MIVGELPGNAMGKVQKTVMRDMYGALFTQIAEHQPGMTADARRPLRGFGMATLSLVHRGLAGANDRQAVC